MTPEELIANFMEPKPPIPDRGVYLQASPGGWWSMEPRYSSTPEWCPNLQDIRLVEKRLNHDQRAYYIRLFLRGRDLRDMVNQGQFDFADAWSLIAEPVTQRIMWLSQVILETERACR